MNYKLLYRRDNFNRRSEIQPITKIICETITLIAPRPTFGGATCTNEWCFISETVTNTENYILGRNYWDTADIHYTIQNERPKATCLTDNAEFSQPLPLIAEIKN